MTAPLPTHVGKDLCSACWACWVDSYVLVCKVFLSAAGQARHPKLPAESEALDPKTKLKSDLGSFHQSQRNSPPPFLPMPRVLFVVDQSAFGGVLLWSCLCLLVPLEQAMQAVKQEYCGGARDFVLKVNPNVKVRSLQLAPSITS